MPNLDTAALVAGSIRLTSGVAFLVLTREGQPLLGRQGGAGHHDPGLLLRSMGYRDALIGGLLVSSALRGRDTRGWFLASGGADAADLLGGLGVHQEMTVSQQRDRPGRRGRRHRGRALGRHSPSLRGS